MKVLNAVNTEEVLTIDIETVRIVEHFKDLPDSYKSAWEYKNKQNGIVPNEEELSDLWTRTAALYPEFSKICAISMLFMTKDGQPRCKSYAGTDEKLILENFSNDLALFKKTKDGVKRDRLVGHAAKYFDYPWLCKRYIIHRMDIPSILDTSDMKPWEHKNLCTNDLYKSFGTGPGSSLQALCVVLGIPISKVDLVGDEVGEAYFRGEIDRIATYCNYDVVSTFNILRVFKQEETFEFDEVVYVKEEYVERVDPTIIEKVKDSGKLGKREANKILKAFKEAPIEEKQEVIINLEAVLLMNNNKTAIKKIKPFQFLKEELLKEDSK